jgi:gluconolactonase
MRFELAAPGLRMGEGPSWRAATRDLLAVSVVDGAVCRVDPYAGVVETFADTAGGPNATAPCADGGAVVTQNGGIDFRALGEALGHELIADPPPPRFVRSGLQRVTPDGTVVSLTEQYGPFLAPNDLAVAPDGSVWFTDPPHFPAPPEPTGRVWRLRSDGIDRIADGFIYCNGIAFEPDGTAVIVEANGLMRIDERGRRDWLIEDLGPGGGDGFAFDRDGRAYACGRLDGVVRVVDQDGQVVDVLEGPSPSFLTNCCFGGDDLRTLFVTDSGNHNLLAFESLPTPGLPVNVWKG